MKMLKPQVFIAILFFCLTSLNAYTLTGRWLENRTESNPYNLFISTEMNNSLVDSLENEWIRFNIGNCLLNWHVTDSVPSMVEGSISDTNFPLLRYADHYYNNDNILIEMDSKNYGTTVIPRRVGDIFSYETFTTTINNNTEFPWYYLGGGHYQIVKDSLMIGGVDINTIFRHEIGHAYNFDHDYLSELDPNFLTLMSDGTVQQDHDFDTLSVGEQELAGLSVIYQPPQLNASTNTVVFGDSILFSAEGSICYPATGLSKYFNSYVSFPEEETYNTDCIMPVTEWEINENINKWGADFYYKPDRLGTFKYKVYTAMNWNTTGNLSLFEANHRPYSEVSFKVVAAPKIESPLPGVQYYTRPSGGKESVITDSIMIKVRVPEVLGSYPAINIKIDGTYVNHGDITFDSTEDVWVYKWDLSTVSPTAFGKMYNITTEIDGDPTDYNSVGVYLVEAVYYEDFQTITDLTAAGWSIQSYEYPPITYTGWVIANDPVAGAVNKVARTFSTYSTAFYYKAFTPVINVPAAEPGKTIKLKYRLYRNDLNPPSTHSLMKFYVCNTSNTPISSVVELYPLTVYGTWVDVVYDVTAYAGQSIKFQWWHYYSGTASCNNTYFCIDDIAVLREPDLEAPAIDFIAGNSADIDADMNLNIGFNDNSGIGSVTADYSIEGDNNSITLSPVKGTYNYTGTIPARDHICEGSITFKIKDSVGNETVSAGHSISWGTGSILTAPENVVITQPTSTTISITWNIVDGATSYKVYSSTDPYGTFTEDTTGTFTESRKWEKTIDGNKYFYYVVAVNALKKEEDEIAKVLLGNKE